MAQNEDEKAQAAQDRLRAAEQAKAQDGATAQADADADAQAKANQRIADLEAELADARAAAQPHGGTITVNAKGEIVKD